MPSKHIHASSRRFQGCCDATATEAPCPHPRGFDHRDWLLELKHDGFRALAIIEGHTCRLMSRRGHEFKRLGLLVEEIAHSVKAMHCVLDGEIVVAKRGSLDFEALQLRIHPAASRVTLLSRQIPASVVFFDLLCQGDRDLRNEPFQLRRKELESLLASATPPIHLTPATSELEVASDWFRRFEGAGLDGVMAKPMSDSYQPDKRVMFKVKHERDCDCVVAGFRWHKRGHGTAVGSLLLGLYDAQEALQHVGVCASFTEQKRRQLVEYLAPYRAGALTHHPWKHWAEQEGTSGEAGNRMPGGQSRWSQGKDLSWQPLRPDLVVEVAYDHMQGKRFRHTAQFRRWRTDKKPVDCTYAQLEVVPPEEISTIFGNSGSDV